MSQSDNKRAASAALNSLKKKWGNDVFSKEDKRDIPSISTGSVMLDDAIGVGGIPEGRLVEIFGPESCGKTSLTTLICAQAQKAKPDEFVAFIDVEHSYNIGYAEQMGLDTSDDKLLFNQPGSAEEALDIVLALAESGACSVIVLDSVAGLQTKSQLEKGIGDATMAEVARIMGQSIPKISKAAARTGTIVLFINQQRSTMAMYGPSETTTGGKTLPYFASLRIKMRKTDVMLDKDIPIGQEVEVKFVKNKVGRPFTQRNVSLLFGQGFDRCAEIVQVAIDQGLVEKRGAWFFFEDSEGEPLKSQGRQGVIDYYRENEEEWNLLYKKLMDNGEQAEDVKDAKDEVEELIEQAPEEKE